MMVLLFYFLVALLTAVTASALIGWFLTTQSSFTSKIVIEYPDG